MFISLPSHRGRKSSRQYRRQTALQLIGYPGLYTSAKTVAALGFVATVVIVGLLLETIPEDVTLEELGAWLFMLIVSVLMLVSADLYVLNSENKRLVSMQRAGLVLVVCLVIFICMELAICFQFSKILLRWQVAVIFASTFPIVAWTMLTWQCDPYRGTDLHRNPALLREGIIHCSYGSNLMQLWYMAINITIVMTICALLGEKGWALRSVTIISLVATVWQSRKAKLTR